MSSRIGYCHANEICVTTTTTTSQLQQPDAEIPGRAIVTRTAACVRQDQFKKYSRPGQRGHPGIDDAWSGVLGQIVGMGNEGGRELAVVVSSGDQGGTTAVEVESLAVSKGSWEEGCRNCAGIEVGEVPGGVGSLGVEAKVVGGVGGLVAGVLWVAVLSG